MGGAAFASGSKPLLTPRMKREVYEAVKSQCTNKLRELFVCVASPIEGPGKADYGDIDFLVCWPKYTFDDKKTALEAVQHILAARRAILTLGDASANYAIPWPEEGASEEARFVQVDVRICQNISSLQWRLFKHAHGDIWNILGSMMRPYGLTIDDEALFIRIPEIENTNRKRAKVILTSEPVETLQLLGLPFGSCWEEPFASRRDMFEYAAQCRLFWVRPADSDEGRHAVKGFILDDPSLEDKTALKSNDRRRMNQRPCFRAWIEEFVAECRSKGLHSEKPTTREAITEEALIRFDARVEFESRRKDFLREKQKDHIIKMIKSFSRPADPSDQKSITYRSCQIKALKRIIIEGDGRYGIMLERNGLFNEDGLYREDELHTFLAAHGSEVGDIAFARHQSVYLEKMARDSTRS